MHLHMIRRGNVRSIRLCCPPETPPECLLVYLQDGRRLRFVSSDKCVLFLRNCYDDLPVDAVLVAVRSCLRPGQWRMLVREMRREVQHG